MFSFLSVLLLFSLLSFGGVLPHSWKAIAILWTLGVAGLLIFRYLKHVPIDVRFVVFLILTWALAILSDSNVVVGALAGGWAWMAAHNNEQRVLRFLHFLILVGLLEASLGLTQYFVEPGWIFGYQGPNKSSGTLINRNHFAGLLGMLTPVTLGLAYRAARRYGDVARPYVYLLAGAFIGLALWFSLSRTGIFSFLITVLFMAIVIRCSESQKKLATALGLGLFGLVMAGALWVGIDVIVERYALLLEQDAALREGRLLVFRDSVKMIAANPWGVGSGKYIDIFRQHQTFRLDLLFDHAHNDYLETAAEWGVITAAVCWSFVLFVLFRSVRAFMSIRSPERRGILLGCIGGIFSILVHSFTDFNLQIPSNAMLFFTFVGIALAMSSPSKEPAVWEG